MIQEKNKGHFVCMETSQLSVYCYECDEFVINGRKWWTSGAMDPRTKVCIFMGKTDTSAARHRQQSMVLLPFDSPGITGQCSGLLSLTVTSQ